jgi:hypothetical protein
MFPWSTLCQHEQETVKIKEAQDDVSHWTTDWALTFKVSFIQTEIDKQSKPWGM